VTHINEIDALLEKVEANAWTY